MLSLIVLFVSAVLAQVAEGQIKCYSGTFSEPQGADDLATFGNCKFCTYRETQYNGKLIEVYYGCADQCEAYDKNGQKLECCEEDLCNAEGGSGGGAPKKENMPSGEMSNKPMSPEEKPDDEMMPTKMPSEQEPADEMPSVENPPMDKPTENESSGGQPASKLPSISNMADEAADQDEY